MTTYTEKEHFIHSIEEHRLPILLDALFWYHCQQYFPNHTDPMESIQHYNAAEEFFNDTAYTRIVICDLLNPEVELATGRRRELPQPLSPPYDYRNEQKESDE